MQRLLSFNSSSLMQVCMFCTMNINDYYTPNTLGEYSLVKGAGKDMWIALSAKKKIDPWGLFLALGYANLTLDCVYCYGVLNLQRPYLVAAQI